MFNEALLDPNQTTTKADLVAPLLLVLAKAELQGRPAMTTQDLRRSLRQLMVPSAQDLEKTPTDDVTRVERAMRNLVSHNDLVRQGLVKLAREREGYSRYTMELTDKGRDWLLDQWMKGVSIPEKAPEPTSDSPRFGFESKLAQLALIVIARIEADTDRPVSTQLLRDGIRRFLPKVNPVDVLPKRADDPSETPLNRAVRNLVSHNTLTSKGWVSRTDDGMRLTAAGRKEVLNAFLALLPDPHLTPAPASSRPRM